MGVQCLQKKVKNNFRFIIGLLFLVTPLVSQAAKVTLTINAWSAQCSQSECSSPLSNTAPQQIELSFASDPLPGQAHSKTLRFDFSTDSSPEEPKGLVKIFYARSDRPPSVPYLQIQVELEKPLSVFCAAAPRVDVPHDPSIELAPLVCAGKDGDTRHGVSLYTRFTR